MHSTSTEITDRSARRTMKGRGSATSFSSIMLDKSVILLTQKMPLLCVHRSGLAALAPSFFTFQRGEGPLLVALGFVKKDTADLTIPVLDLLDSRVETGVAACKESEELVVTVSQQIPASSFRPHLQSPLAPEFSQPCFRILPKCSLSIEDRRLCTTDTNPRVVQSCTQFPSYKKFLQFPS